MSWRLVPRLVLSREDFDVLRRLRNDCREFFTNHTAEISFESQQMYIEHFDPRRVRHYIYSYMSQDVAFSRITTNEAGTESIVTFGIDHQHRGIGLGWDLCQMALMAAGLPIGGDRLVSNSRVAHIDDMCGYRAIGPAVDGKEPVHCPWPPPFVLPMRPQQSQQSGYDEIVRYHRYGEQP